jgi:uncharacterized membrane protein
MLRRLAGPLFIVTGALHFVIPDTFVKIVPRYLPGPRALVYASGVAEIAGGAGLIDTRTRRWAGWWLIATLIAVFPANLEMALHPDRYDATTSARKGLLIARLPLQLAFIAWVRVAARGPAENPA